MILNTEAIVKEARIRCQNAGFRMIQEDKFMPRTDGKAMYVQRIDPKWSDRELDLWWYTFEHELGHNDPEMLDSFELLREKKLIPNSFLAAMLNLTEDNRQEHHRYNEYAGRKKRLNVGRKIFYEDVLDSSNYGQVGADEHRLAAEVWFVWDALVRAKWMSSLIGIGENLAKKLNAQQLEWLEKFLDGDYDSTLRSGINAEQEYELVKRIIREVFNFDDEQEEQDAQQEAEGKGKEGADGDAGDNESNTEGGSSTEETGEEGDKEGRSKKAEVDYSDLLAHQHEQEESSSKNPYGEGLHINYDSGTGRFETRDPSTYRITDYTKGANCNHVDARCYGAIEAYTTNTGLAKSVRRLLQTKMQTRYRHGLKRGRISSKSIYRAAMPNSGQYQRRVFRKKDEQLELDVAISLLMDCSGSMMGSKYFHAGASVVMLNEALGSLRVPVEIAGFDDQPDTMCMYVWKSFNKAITRESLIERLSDSYERSLSNNSDGESILWSYQRLTKQKAKRKVMIVLSDGSPAAWHGDANWYTNEVIQGIKKAGIVEMYGIGIMDNNVTRLYEHSQVISSASELESAVLNVIKRKVLG